MQKDYFEINLKKLMQKCRPAVYRPEFKEDLFRRMTREIKLNTKPAPKWGADIFINWLQPVGFRLFLEAAAVPMLLLLVGISYLINSRTNLPVEDGKVIIFQSADNRDYIMGNGQNAVNYFAHASSSHGSGQIRTDIHAGDLRQDSLQMPVTNNS